MVTKTFSYIKPNALWAKDQIFKMIRENGFKIKRSREGILSQETAEFLYGCHKDKPFYKELIEFTISGPSIMLILEKIGDAVTDFRELIGSTNPANAKEGTIRKLFGDPNGGPANAIHGSDSPRNAIREIKYFFPEEEI